MEINQLINDLHHVNSELKQRTERINQLESKEELLFEIYKKTKILDNLKRQLLISTDKKENAKYTMDAIRDKVDSMAENFKSDATALIELKKEIFRNLGLKIWMKPIENNDDLWEIKVFYSESTLYYVVLQYFVPSDSFECKLIFFGLIMILLTIKFHFQ